MTSRLREASRARGGAGAPARRPLLWYMTSPLAGGATSARRLAAWYGRLAAYLRFEPLGVVQRPGDTLDQARNVMLAVEVNRDRPLAECDRPWVVD